MLQYISSRTPRARVRFNVFVFANFQILIGGYSHHYDKVGTFFWWSFAQHRRPNVLDEKDEGLACWQVVFAKSQMLQSLIKINVSLDTASTVEHFPLCQSVE